MTADRLTPDDIEGMLATAFGDGPSRILSIAEMAAIAERDRRARDELPALVMDALDQSSADRRDLLGHLRAAMGLAAATLTIAPGAMDGARDDPNVMALIRGAAADR